MSLWTFLAVAGMMAVCHALKHLGTCSSLEDAEALVKGDKAGRLLDKDGKSTKTIENLILRGDVNLFLRNSK